MKKKITILACNGDSPAGYIVRQASQELVDEGKAEYYSAKDQKIDFNALKDIDPEYLIILDGCEKQCALNMSLEKGLPQKHCLELSYLAIEPENMEDIGRGDIELAKDGIIAECTPVDKQQLPPMASCGCC